MKKSKKEKERRKEDTVGDDAKVAAPEDVEFMIQPEKTTPRIDTSKSVGESVVKMSFHEFIL